jgi:hypothetical protein
MARSRAATAFREYRSSTTDAAATRLVEQHGDVSPILWTIEVLLFGNELRTTEVVSIDGAKSGVDPRAPRLGEGQSREVRQHVDSHWCDAKVHDELGIEQSVDRDVGWRRHRRNQPTRG